MRTGLQPIRWNLRLPDLRVFGKGINYATASLENARYARARIILRFARDLIDASTRRDTARDSNGNADIKEEEQGRNARGRAVLSIP